MQRKSVELIAFDSLLQIEISSIEIIIRFERNLSIWSKVNTDTNWNEISSGILSLSDWLFTFFVIFWRNNQFVVVNTHWRDAICCDEFMRCVFTTHSHTSSVWFEDRKRKFSQFPSRMYRWTVVVHSSSYSYIFLVEDHVFFCFLTLINMYLFIFITSSVRMMFGYRDNRNYENQYHVQMLKAK